MTSSSGRSIGERRQGDGGRGVPTERLETSAAPGACAADDALVAAVGDDRDVVGQARETVDRSLQQRSLAEQRQEGLRALGSAQRLESGPAAAGEDHGVHAPLV